MSSLLQRLSLAFAVLAGSYPSADQQELEMDLTKAKAQVAELTAALTRAQAMGGDNLTGVAPAGS